MQPNHKKTIQRNALFAIGGGVLLILAGIILTIVSYNNAGPGEQYTIWWGLPLVGIAIGIRGAISLATADKQARKLDEAARPVQQDTPPTEPQNK
jgi:uncharacterized membrane protein YccC